MQGALALSASSISIAEAPEAKLVLLKGGVGKIAFIVSDQATLIDMAGPMQTFDQVQSPGSTGFQDLHGFRNPPADQGGRLTIVPDYTFADAPDTDIVVVGAQTGRSAPLPPDYHPDHGRQGEADALGLHRSQEVRPGRPLGRAPGDQPPRLYRRLPEGTIRRYGR